MTTSNKRLFYIMRIGQILALVLATAATAAFAAPPKPVEQFNSTALWFENWSGLSNATMTVVAPSGESSEIFEPKGTPVYKLASSKAEDGIYRYELSAATEERVKVINKIDNGRGDKARDSVAVPFYLEGAFTVQGGRIIRPKEVNESDFKPEEPGEPGKDVLADGDEGSKPGESKPIDPKKDVLVDGDG